MFRFFWVLLTRLLLTFLLIALITGGIGYGLYWLLT
jgi:hypothetical protein